MLTRICTAFAKQEELDTYIKQIEKPKSATIAGSLGSIYSISGRGARFGLAPHGWTLFNSLKTIFAAGNRPVSSSKLAPTHGRAGSPPAATYNDMMFLTAGRRKTRASRHQADGVRPRADFQKRSAIYRELLKDRRIRQGASLRALGRITWADARARVHWDDAHLLTENQIAEEVLGSTIRSCRSMRTSAFPTCASNFRSPGKAHWRRRGMGQGRVDGGAQASGRPWTQRRRRSTARLGMRHVTPSARLAMRHRAVDLNPQPARRSHRRPLNKVTVMLHRAMFGPRTLHRILIFCGHFPLWLSPPGRGCDHHRTRQLRAKYSTARRSGLRAELDLRNEKINYKVRGLAHKSASAP
jgi:hypothetical protein